MSSMWNVEDQYKGLPLSAIQKAQKNLSLPYSVCVLNVTGDLNVGNIIRTACVFGAREVLVLGKRRYDKRSCVGSYNYISVTQLPGDITDREFFETEIVHKRNYNPVFIEQGGLSFREASLPKNPCFVFGNESTGIPSNLLRNNICYSLTQRGVLRSLNVSNTAAIVCHEAMQLLQP